MSVTLSERYRGSLLGLACGDALGATLEFSKRGTFEPITNMNGGGPFDLLAGQWTDDTSMALCLAESLICCKGFDAEHQMQMYVKWWKTGFLSATGKCFDIGVTTRRALIAFEKNKQVFSGDINPRAAGNGSLMRLAPVVLFYYPNNEKVSEFSALSSMTTHAASEAVECCRLFALILANALSGKSKEDVIQVDNVNLKEPRVLSLSSAWYRQKTYNEVSGTGYCVASLEAALWCFYHTDSFEASILAAANLGDDADTTAAIVGQLAGAYYGIESIPKHWLSKLHMRDKIEDVARALYTFSRPVGHS